MKALYFLLIILGNLFVNQKAFNQDMISSEALDHCTSILVTKGASHDGSVMATHSCDGNYEFRIHLIPGTTHESGAVRPVFKGGGQGRERAQARIVGEIPQVEQTWTRYDAAYSFMNEKQLGMGETTIGGKRELYNDEGYFDIMELQRIALERASTAREAIQLMGSLAARYGYSDYGECLTVIDPQEAWMFEIFGAGPMEIGAVWAARRIPDGHVGVSANRSRIATIDLKDKDHYMASENVYTVAEEMGWWEPDGDKVFRFNEVYGRVPTYNNIRREWRVLELLAPSLKRDPWDRDVPFSVKPDEKVHPRDLMRIHRDYYEGTEFDMTKALASGPFGSPNRWSTRTRPPEGTIGWERSISIFRCSYCTVIQCRDWLPDWIGGLVWFAEDDPKTSCYVPFYCGITQLPKSFEIGGRDQYDQESAFWAFNFVGNWAELKFSYMIKDIKEKYTSFENGFFEMQPFVEKTAVDLYKKDPKLARAYLTDYSCTKAQGVVDAWRALGTYLITKYSDGYINLPTTGRSVGYPQEWLDKVEFGKRKIKK
jgi:dipeptidase